jgi:hypothetical protein
MTVRWPPSITGAIIAVITATTTSFIIRRSRPPQ